MKKEMLCLADAEEVIRLYNAAADKFIAKVVTGRAKSIETYAELKAAREAARSLGLGE